MNKQKKEIERKRERKRESERETVRGLFLCRVRYTFNLHKLFYNELPYRNSVAYSKLGKEVFFYP